MSPTCEVDGMSSQLTESDIDNSPTKKIAKTSKHRQQKFRDAWLKYEDYKQWLRRVPENQYKAKCRTCNATMNAESTVLKNHMKSKVHLRKSLEAQKSVSTLIKKKAKGNRFSVDSKKIIAKIVRKSPWQYFDIENNKFEARCKLCDRDIPYDSDSELTEHVRDHDVIVSDDDDVELITESKKMPNKKRSSPLWRYMKDLGDECAVCQICQKKLSYMTGSSNLMKHLKRVHPELNLDGEDDHKVLISANGQLYEVQASDVEEDPINTDEVFLDSDFDDNSESSKTQTQSQKRTKLIDKHNNRKSKELSNISSRSNRSEEDNNIVKKQNKNDSLDCFGSYIATLLKELPKHISDRLQSDIVKLIIDEKIALNSLDTTGIKPITLTINNGPNNIPEITVKNVIDEGV